MNPGMEEETGDKTDTLSEDEPDNQETWKKRQEIQPTPYRKKNQVKTATRKKRPETLLNLLPEEESGNVKDEKMFKQNPQLTMEQTVRRHLFILHFLT